MLFMITQLISRSKSNTHHKYKNTAIQ